METAPQQHAPREVVITGLGLVSPYGAGRAAHARWEREALATPTLQGATEGQPVRAALQVAKAQPQPFMLRRKDLKLMSRDAQLALEAAGLALQDAGLSPLEPATWPVSAHDVGLYMGVGLEPGDISELALVVADARGEGGRVDLQRLGGHSLELIPPLSSLKTLPNMALAHVSINLGLMGPGEALSPSGTAGLVALGAAREAIERGECEMALVGAADSDVDLSSLAALVRMDLVARLGPDEAEFLSGMLDRHDRPAAGEGAAFFVLESGDLARRRGARVLGRVGEVCSRGPRGARVGARQTDGLAEVLGGLLGQEGELLRVFGVPSRPKAWSSEVAGVIAAALRGRLESFREESGWYAAASGLLPLGIALAEAAAEQAPGPILGVAWGPGGDWAGARVEVLGEEGA